MSALHRSRSGGSLPPLSPLRTALAAAGQPVAHLRVQVKREQPTQQPTAAEPTSDAAVTDSARSYAAPTPHVKVQPVIAPVASAAASIHAAPQFDDADAGARVEEYAMQWDITADASRAAAATAPAMAPSAPHAQQRPVQSCPVRGCHARYVNPRTLHKHMIAMHRGARATRDIAAGMDKTLTGRKKRVASSSSSAHGSSSSAHSTPNVTPQKAPRPHAHRQADESPPRLARESMFTLSQLTASAATAKSRANGTARDDDEDDDDDEEESDEESSDSDSDESSGVPRPVAMPVRLPNEMRASVAAQTTSKSARPVTARRTEPPPPTVATYPPASRSFPSYALMAAFPPQARDGLHPLLQLLTKSFASYFSTPVCHRGDSFTVDEIFVHYLLSRYDARAGLDRLAFQALLTRSLWIRGGLERWARNWKRFCVKPSIDSPFHARHRGTRSPSRASSALALPPLEDESDEETWWRYFTLSRRYRPRVLLSRITSFLDVTFEHGEGRTVPLHEQEEKKRLVLDIKRWVAALPPAPSVPTHRPMTNEVNDAQSPVKPHRESVKQPRPASAPAPAAAASSTRSSPTRAPLGSSCVPPTTPTGASSASDSPAAMLTWSKASLEQLNSLLLANDGRVDRNLTLRQISDTLGKSVDDVRQQVAQVRKLKEIEEARALSRVERERTEQQLERTMQRAAKKAAAPTKDAKQAAAYPVQTSNLLHVGDTAHLDSSLVPSIGNRGRKRRAKGGLDLPLQMMPAQVNAPVRTQPTAAAAATSVAKIVAPPSKKPPAPAPASAPSRRASPETDSDSDSDSVASEAPAAAVTPPAKRQRMTKQKKAELVAAAAAATANSTVAHPPQTMPYQQQPHPHQHQSHPHYPMMPYGAMHYPPYPYPMMPPPPPPPPSSSTAASSSQSAESPATQPPPHPFYPQYPPSSYPPAAYPYPPSAWPPHSHSYPPPPPHVGADGQPMQWSWMLVPMPAAAPNPHAAAAAAAPPKADKRPKRTQ